MNKKNKINPLSCDIQTFLQHYSKYKVEERKETEYEICWFYEKNSYSYAQVRQLLRIMKTSHSRTHNKLGLRYYKCPCCNSYHLTSEKTYKGNPKPRFAA